MEAFSERSPCSDLDIDLLKVMREVAKMQMGHGLDYDSKILERAREQAQKRFEEAQHRRAEASEELEKAEAELMMEAVEQLLESERSLEQILEDIEFDEKLRRLEAEIEALGKESQKLTRADLDEALSEYERRGLIDARAPTIKLTSKGSRVLGRGFLTRILDSLRRRGVGPHRVEELGHGPWLSSTYRPYEYGDSYERINIERSLLAALERSRGLSDLELSDFKVYESIHHSEVHFGILVDQSGSMNRDGKMEAAVETALALSELMRIRFPEDELRVFAFSEEVREVEPWELPGIAVPMKYRGGPRNREQAGPPHHGLGAQLRGRRVHRLRAGPGRRPHGGPTIQDGRHRLQHRDARRRPGTPGDGESHSERQGFLHPAKRPGRDAGGGLPPLEAGADPTLDGAGDNDHHLA